MLARLMTWVVYAVVFFLLGAWVGGFSLGLRALMREGAQEAQVGGEIVWRWARNTISEARAPAPGAAEPTAKDLLQSARAAFARGDIDQSISLYQELLKKEPGDVDARGELGNVLFDAGRLQEASRTYYETALRLAQAGDGERARALEPIIRRNAPQLADRLENELKALAVSGKQSARRSLEDRERTMASQEPAATRWRESGAGLAARGAPRPLRQPED
jgi:tetratricopeptide (TPR) repeat protein